MYYGAFTLPETKTESDINTDQMGIGLGYSLTPISGADPELLLAWVTKHQPGAPTGYINKIFQKTAWN